MADPVKKSKKFVTNNVDGFPDGHVMELRGACNSAYIEYGQIHLFAGRKTENGIDLFAIIPVTPEAMDAHVRIKMVPDAALPNRR